MKNYFWKRMAVTFAGALSLGMGGAAKADDGMFPAAPTAKAAIDYDGKGFLVRGKRTFLASGSLHYSRVPRALWRDRLLRIKRAGFNTVETYAFWNFHEAQEGKWDFAGGHDFNAYLKLINDLGMYAIVRVGPYVCAEWENGGYPTWLRFKPGVRVREDNPQFESCVDKWFDKIMPIVAANQIHRGGAVILVQLENEHPQGWGREIPNGYFRHLRDKAVALGLEVPYFFSGLHHGHDPAGNQPWDSADRSNPWFTTEFWPGWYDLYGELSAGDLRTYERGTWKILAYGGNGYNFYMLHGGTDFDTWNDDEVASNYDYGAAVGQTGDLRTIYYRFKRASLFARSFADVLENSTNATEEVKNDVASGGVRLTARKSPAGTLLFADNPSNQPVIARIRKPGGDATANSAESSDAITLELAPGEIVPLARNVALGPDVTLEASACRILGMVAQGNTTTLVVYDAALGTQEQRNAANLPLAHRAELHFRVPAAQTKLISTGPELAFDFADTSRVTLKATFQPHGVAEYAFVVGAHKFRVLAVSSDLADRTYFAEAGGQTYIIGGFPYIGEVQAKNGGLQVVAEQYARRIPIPADDVFAYGPGDKPLRLQVVSKAELQDVSGTHFSPEQITPPSLGAWQMHRADEPASVSYSTGNWRYSPQPLQMGADGDTGAYAWYRTVAQAAKAGTVNLKFTDIGDWIAVWANGQRVTVGAKNIVPRQRFTSPLSATVAVPLQAGMNTIAVFAAHYGRNKLFNHLGPIDQIAAKGLNGPVVLSKSAPNEQTVAKWQWKPAGGMTTSRIPAVVPEDVRGSADWKTLNDPKTDVFDKQPGFAWFRADLAPLPGQRHVLHFEDVDDNATVYLNGKKVGAHQGWGQAFDMPLETAWKAGQVNKVVVLVENTANTGGIPGAVTLRGSNVGDETELRGWKMRGGIDNPMQIASWQPLGDRSNQTGVPTFFRSDFSTDFNSLPDRPGTHPILRVALTNLTRGFIWLNGHNLGRYPEKVPIKSLYLPECWLNRGKNTLTVFDEEGTMPLQVRLVVEPATSRQITEYTAAL